MRCTRRSVKLVIIVSSALTITRIIPAAGDNASKKGGRSRPCLLDWRASVSLYVTVDRQHNHRADDRSDEPSTFVCSIPAQCLTQKCRQKRTDNPEKGGQTTVGRAQGSVPLLDKMIKIEPTRGGKRFIAVAILSLICLVGILVLEARQSRQPVTTEIG